jgi:hypothetical protein
LQNAKLMAQREDLKLQCLRKSDSAAANNADNKAVGQN